jgi:predicted flap endonuclease-1-like 5' DNA nuclease
MKALFMLAWLAEEPVKPGLPWWVIILIVFIVLALLIWLLTRKGAKDDQPVRMAQQVQLHPDGGHAAPAPAVPDDIEMIEGIGPKIAHILRRSGITTFAQLANTDVARLQQLMKENNLRIADPTTWPEQARLAADGKQEELKKLQNSLRAGRRTSTG